MADRTKGYTPVIIKISAPNGITYNTDIFRDAEKAHTSVRLKLNLFYMNKDRSVSEITGVTGNEMDVEITITGCVSRNSAGKVIRFYGYINGAVTLAVPSLKINELDKYGRPRLDNARNPIQQTDTTILNETDGTYGAYVEGIFDQTRNGGELEFYGNDRFDVNLGTSNFEDPMHDKSERRTPKPTKVSNSVDRRII